MLSALRGEDVVAPEAGEETATKEQADFSDFNTEDIKFSYCTEFIVSRENKKDPEALRAFLNELGDSLVLVDDEEIIKVHVHTNDPGAALHEAVNYGSFVTVKVENMRLQHTEKVMNEKDMAPKIAEPEKPIGVVSVCAGAGLAACVYEPGGGPDHFRRPDHEPQHPGHPGGGRTRSLRRRSLCCPTTRISLWPPSRWMP